MFGLLLTSQPLSYLSVQRNATYPRISVIIIVNCGSCGPVSGRLGLKDETDMDEVPIATAIRHPDDGVLAGGRTQKDY
jgi:hypothetical protein